MRRNCSIGFFVGVILISALYIFSDVCFREEVNGQEQQAQEVTVSGDEKVYTYYLFEEEGRVNVYQSDRSTLYERTSILVETLPDSLQDEIQEGKPIRDAEELYDFLENYSS